MQNVYTKKSALNAILLFILIFSSFVVSANETLLKKLDVNNDGKISIKEAVAEPKLLAVFGQIDKDGDGNISKIELQQLKDIEKKWLLSKLK